MSTTEEDAAGAVRPVIYHAAGTPAPACICARAGCLLRAQVRLTHPNGTSRDLCGHDFAYERSQVVNDPEHPGIVHDDTGDVATLKAEFGAWAVTMTDSGRLYAVNGVTTVSAFLVSHLRSEITRAERSWARA